MSTEMTDFNHLIRFNVRIYQIKTEGMVPLCWLFPLDCRWWFRCDVVQDAVDVTDFVDDAN